MRRSLAISAAALCSLTACEASVYIPVEEDDLPPQCRRPGKGRNKRWLERLPQCGAAFLDLYDLCRGGRRGTGTSSQLNNCGKFDLYYYEDDWAEDSDNDNDNDVEDEQPWWGGRPTPRPTLRPTARPTPRRPSPRPTPRPATEPFQFPQYSQQCRDDAGPVWEDDAEIYGEGKRYHDQSRALAVLQDGECAGPLKAACAARGGPSQDNARAAYLEGPVQCNGKGWFCRILPDENHGGGDQSDWNFNHCNRTEYGDSDGHCHGSNYDDTFYWWVRDHWHRNYAGRLHCCCDWEATKNVVARCDYRAHLEPGQNARCRDANEDHNGPGSGFLYGYEAGCENLGRNPLPEPDEAQCWDVLNFAPGRDAD